jgi:hypothetical protein
MSNNKKKNESVKFTRRSNFNGIYSVNNGTQIILKDREIYETNNPEMIEFFDNDPEIVRMKEEHIDEFNQQVLTTEEKENIKKTNKRMREAEIGLKKLEDKGTLDEEEDL